MRGSAYRRATSILAVAALAVAAATTAAPAHAKRIPEVAAPWLDDVALALTTESGPVIFYNPSRCKAVGADVCAFLRAHEHAHIRLNHASAFYTSLVGRAVAEADADCWAARNVFLVQAKAAIAFFSAPGRADVEVGQHGTGLERAKRIKACRGI